jgi:hypothetical protein
MMLEINGRKSSSRRTCHMNIRYFFIKDYVDNNEIVIKHCETSKTLGDLFIKPLQGMMFHKIRDRIMSIDPSSKYHSDHKSVLKSEVISNLFTDVSEVNDECEINDVCEINVVTD